MLTIGRAVPRDGRNQGGREHRSGRLYVVVRCALPRHECPSIYKKLGYDPIRRFSPLRCSRHQIIVVNPTVPAHSLREEPAIASPLEFGGFIAAETQKWAAVIDAAGIKVD